MIKKKISKKNNVIDFPAKLSQIEKEIEAIIFAAAEPLDIETIQSKISKRSDVEKILKKLQIEYSNRGINLVCISKKWSFRTSPNLSNLMAQEKTVEKKLSKAAIETLSIIVYHQPVTRAEIEEIRGVAFGTNTIEILMELNWVKPGGRKNVPGKPIQYVTTDDFLSHFNLQKLSDLPTVDELGAAGLIDSTNIDNAIFGTGKFYRENQENKKEDNTKTPINTQRTGVTTHRVGQDLFRRKLLIKFNNKCAVTGIENEEMLLASHILPWRDADDFQRLDIENGILLDPFYDKLFDRFFISFSDSGKIILSEKLKKSQKLMEFVDTDAVIEVTDGMKKYLKIHRKNLKN